MIAALLVAGVALAVLGVKYRPLTVAASCCQALGVAILAADVHSALLK